MRACALARVDDKVHLGSGHARPAGQRQRQPRVCPGARAAAGGASRAQRAQVSRGACSLARSLPLRWRPASRKKRVATRRHCVHLSRASLARPHPPTDTHTRTQHTHTHTHAHTHTHTHTNTFPHTFPRFFPHAPAPIHPPTCTFFFGSLNPLSDVASTCPRPR